MVLSVAIMASYLLLQAQFGPKRPEPDPAIAKQVDEAKKKAGEQKADDKKGTADPEQEPKKTPAGETVKKPDETPAVQPEATIPAAPQLWATLGSVDPASPYRILATFNSRGAAIERIELSNPTYRDLEDRSGYLGHLALTDLPRGQGCKVNIVGAGTPAALAVEAGDSKLVGLRVGDVIDGFAGEKVGDQTSLAAFLKSTKPGETIKLNVTRTEKDVKQALVFSIDLIRRPLEVIRPEFEVLPPSDPPEAHPLSCLMTLVSSRQLSGGKALPTVDPLKEAHWVLSTSTDKDKNQIVEFSYKLTTKEAEELGLSGPVEVIKRYWLATTANEEQHADPTTPAYHLEFEIELKNLHDASQEVAWQLDGPNGLPYEGWWYSNKISPGWGGAGARDIVWRKNGKSRNTTTCPQVYTYAQKNPTKPAESLLGTEETSQFDYVGVDAQYFSAILMPNVAGDAAKSTFRKAYSKPAYGIQNIKKIDYKRTNTTFQVTSDLKPLAANGSYKQTMRLFLGPKVPTLLAKYHVAERGIDDVIEYGWFKMVSIPLSGLLHFLKHNLLFNYGLSIIALTVIVRGCMYPFSLKAAKNAQLMQEISPELKKIAEKYKNDLQKRGEAQSELFKKYNYHPLSGCAPMFLQLPIFLGLYRSLAVDIELRQAALIPGIDWCSNLAGPDMLFYWRPYLWEYFSGEASGWLGPYFNLLPLISVALLQVHQRLFTPPATDEQTKMTQDMMKYMTLFMGVLFFKVPAGLCIYFITSSLWSVVERLTLPKMKPPTSAGGGGGDGGAEAKPTKPTKPAMTLSSFFATKPNGNSDAKLKAARKAKKRQ